MSRPSGSLIDPMILYCNDKFHRQNEILFFSDYIVTHLGEWLRDPRHKQNKSPCGADRGMKGKRTDLSLIDSLALRDPQVSLPLSGRAPASLRVVVSRRVAA